MGPIGACSLIYQNACPLDRSRAITNRSQCQEDVKPIKAHSPLMANGLPPHRSALATYLLCTISLVPEAQTVAQRGTVRTVQVISLASALDPLSLAVLIRCRQLLT